MVTIQSWLSRNGLYVGWLISLIATSGSLFLSEVLHWQPCELCWLQRIFMYPQVVLLGIAVIRNDRKIWPYTFTLSAIGFGFSIYHYLIQHIPALATYAPCIGGSVSCETDYISLFGFVTIPVLAGVAFTLIMISMWFVGTLPTRGFRQDSQASISKAV